MSFPNTSNDIQLSGFMRLKDVLKLIPVSKATWSAGVERGIYPQPFHPSAGTSAWKTSDIANLIEQISNAQVKNRLLNLTGINPVFYIYLQDGRPAVSNECLLKVSTSLANYQ